MEELVELMRDGMVVARSEDEEEEEKFHGSCTVAEYAEEGARLSVRAEAKDTPRNLSQKESMAEKNPIRCPA